MKIVIIGQKWLAAETLTHCIARGHAVSALAMGNDSFLKVIKASNAPLLSNIDSIPECDIIIAAHLHDYLPGNIRAKSRHGVIAYHPSLLPLHRGRDAVRWAIHMRERVTGGTVYRMDDGADTGEILLQDWCHIYSDDTAQSLWRRDLAPMGVQLITSAIDIIAQQGFIEGIKQDERLATFEPAFNARKLKIGEK